MLVNKNLDIQICLSFIAGLCNSGRVTVGFIYCQEFLDQRYKDLFGLAFSCLEVWTTMVITGYFWMGFTEYLGIALVGLALLLVGSVVGVMWVPESPLW